MEQEVPQAIAGGRKGAQRREGWCAAGGRPSAGRFLLALALAAAMTIAGGNAHATSAKLYFGETTISFPSADPDLVLSIGALENPITVRVDIAGAASTVSQLTVEAGGDLMSGSERIPVDQINWTATGSGFVSGTLSSTQPQLVGQWVGKVDRTGQLQFWLQNSWLYAVGNYSQNVVYTLIAY